jgi:hypothetical protein
MNIARFNVHYKLNISLNLPNDLLNYTSEITFENHILNRFVKGYILSKYVSSSATEYS